MKRKKNVVNGCLQYKNVVNGFLQYKNVVDILFILISLFSQYKKKLSLSVQPVHHWMQSRFTRIIKNRMCVCICSLLFSFHFTPLPCIKYIYICNNNINFFSNYYWLRIDIFLLREIHTQKNSDYGQLNYVCVQAYKQLFLFCYNCIYICMFLLFFHEYCRYLYAKKTYKNFFIY